jgi:hypothetical protein
MITLFIAIGASARSAGTSRERYAKKFNVSVDSETLPKKAKAALQSARLSYFVPMSVRGD